jgi:asparagine synthase (glutamine-hydrolysing)
MAELIGICLGARRQESARAVLAEMTAVLRPGSSADTCVDLHALSFVVRKTSGPAFVGHDGERHIILLGHARWSHSELAELARRQGAAAAVSEACRRFRADFLEHLHGEFALCIVDRRERSVLLAVDRFCTYPLAYAVTPEGDLVFGTSSRAIGTSRLVNAQVSAPAIYQYLYFNIVPTPHSAFAGVTNLLPGTSVRYSAGALSPRQYWHPTFEKRPASRLGDLTAEVHELLDQAVARCSPDASVGAFLSGGLDSSTVAGVLHRLNVRPVRTFSIGFDVAGFDELEYARAVARHFGTEQHEYYVTADDVARAAQIVAEAYDEPFGNSSAIAVHFCARLAAEHGVRTMLAGDGGDEIFGGNARYSKQLVFSKYWKIPAALRANLVEPLLLARWMPHNVPLLRKLQSYVAQARTPLPDRLESYNLFTREGTQQILHPDFAQQVRTSEPLEDLRSWYAAAPSTEVVDQMLAIDWKLTLADNDLHKVGRMCSLANVDVRYPFLDSDLFDFALQLPAHHKVRAFELRWFYRRAMRGFLPESTLSKHKHGFGLPFGLWLRDHAALRTLVMDSLADFRRRRIVAPQFIDLIISRHTTDHATYYGTFIWTILMLELWFRNHPGPGSVTAFQERTSL